MQLTWLVRHGRRFAPVGGLAISVRGAELVLRAADARVMDPKD